MRVTFYCSDKPREHMIANALRQGVEKAGDSFEIRRTQDYGDDCTYEGPTPDTDVACVFGVKGKSRQIIDDHLSRGKSAVYLDKGYTRDKGEAGHTLYSRACVNAGDATAYFQRTPHAPGRFSKFGLKVCAKRNSQHGFVLFCGSSQKYHDFHRLGDATQYASNVIRKLRKITSRTIVYRPKPSWRDAVPVDGALYSPANTFFDDALRGCYCVVTHGSNAAVHAILQGYPCLILGDGIAKPVAETSMDKVDEPRWTSDEARFCWAEDLAWTQFNNDELRNGMAWAELRSEIEHQQKTAVSQ